MTTLTVETWCEALESGKYEQTPGRLRLEDRFCCLGVACDLSDVGVWDDDGYNRKDGIGRSELRLPSPVVKALGLSDDVGSFDFYSLPDELREKIADCVRGLPTGWSLSGLNDRDVPFPLIAKVIRARPKGLFREDVAP